MLRTRIIPVMQSNISLRTFNAIMPNSFHTTQIFDKKYKKSKGKGKSKSVAIILSGCGYLDGTEISEAISVTIHISEQGMKPCFYAPDMLQPCIIDHQLKEEDTMSSIRNVLIESARLAKSDIKSLCECDACSHGALVLPGGFGAAKTLSNFAKKGACCKVQPDVEKLIQDFYCEKKPIGTICIASAVVARVLKGVKVTVGKECPPDQWKHADVIPIIREMGAKVELKNVTEISECKKYRVVSTPAWMDSCATYADVHKGIGKLICIMKKYIS